VLHDDARPEWIAQAGVVKGNCTGVVEPGHQQRFALEPVAEFGVGGNVVVHHLDDDIAAQIELPGEVDLTHSTFTKKAAGFVSTQENATDHARSLSGPKPAGGMQGQITLVRKIVAGAPSCGILTVH